MAGSSLPVSFVNLIGPLPWEALLLPPCGYSGLDIYGTHTLEVYQAMVERRLGARRESGRFNGLEPGNVAEGRGWNGRCRCCRQWMPPQRRGHSRLSAGSGRRWGGLVPLNTLMDFKVPSSCYLVTWPGVALLRGWENASIRSVGIEERMGTPLPARAYLLKAMKPWYGPAGPAVPSRGPCSHRGCWIGY